jgi:hypothetical protein
VSPTSSEILIPVASSEHRESVAGGKRTDDGLDVLGLGRADLHPLLPR